MVTADEDSWLGLAANFARAVSSGQPGRTYQLGHPGVTSLWVTIAGVGLERLVPLAGLVEFHGNVATRRAIEDVPEFFSLLAAARLAHAIANALLVSVIALLVWRLLGWRTALIVGLLLALDPFLIAHAQIVRMDGLQASLATVVVLAAAVRWLSDGHRAFAVLSGTAFGLAMLSKVSSLFVLPLLGGLAGLSLWRAYGDQRNRSAAPVRMLAQDLLLWTAVASITFVALWPSMLVAPYDTLRAVLEFSTRNSGTPPEAGNFFLGSVVADPGPLFYPVALALRSTPLVLLGLLLLPLALLGNQSLERRRLFWALLICLLVEAVLLSAAVKKFDRYALPIVPLLVVLAGVGLVQLGSQRGHARRALLPVAGAAAVFQLTVLPPLAPYPLAYFNPLLGGARIAQQVLLVGWGEGLELAAARLNELPGADDLVVSAFHEQALDASFEGEALPLERFAEADYLVLPIDATQRGLMPAVLTDALSARAPDLLVPIAGLDYVRIYRLPGSVFGEAVRVDRVTVDRPLRPLGGRLAVEIVWRPLAAAAIGAIPSIQLVDGVGAAAADPVLSSVDAHEVDERGERLKSTARLESPRRAGRYALSVTVSDRAGNPLPVTERPPWTSADGGRLILSDLSIRYR